MIPSWFFDGFQGFWQGSSLQVVQNAANTYVETRNHLKKNINEIYINIPIHWIHKKKTYIEFIKKNKKNIKKLLKNNPWFWASR